MRASGPSDPGNRHSWLDRVVPGERRVLFRGETRCRRAETGRAARVDCGPYGIARRAGACRRAGTDPEAPARFEPGGPRRAPALRGSRGRVGARRRAGTDPGTPTRSEHGPYQLFRRRRFSRIRWTSTRFLAERPRLSLLCQGFPLRSPSFGGQVGGHVVFADAIRAVLRRAPVADGVARRLLRIGR